MDILHQSYATVSSYLPTASVLASIVLSALLPIFTGAHASLSRPSTAAPRKKEQGDKLIEEEDDEEETLQPMESLTALDAILFPVVAACILATLYWLIKRYGAKIINLIMSWYLAGAGVISVIKLFSDGLTLALSFVFPPVYGLQGHLWSLTSIRDQTVFHSRQHGQPLERSSPLPARLSMLPLPQFGLRLLWQLRSMAKQRYNGEMFVRGVMAVKAKMTIVDMVAIVFGLAVVGYSNFIHSYWWLTNIQGFAVSYFALQMLSPTSFAVGSLVLSGLFVYDIWAVFFTPLMVTVATELDQPIKLLFPRYDLEQADEAMQYSMLGLGDIVLPGLLVGLSLRYDLYMFYLRKQVTKEDSKVPVKRPYTSPRGHWASRYWTGGLPESALPRVLRDASFPKPFFYASLIGYTIGLSATLAMVVLYQHAQPALLYLVPAVLLCVWGTGMWRGELQHMWSYSEEVTAEATPGSTTSQSNDSERDSKDPSWWHSFSNLFSPGDTPGATSDESKSTTTVKNASSDPILDIDNDVIIKVTLRRVSPISTISSTAAKNSASGDTVKQVPEVAEQVAKSQS